MNVLFSIANVCWALVTLALAAGTVWSVVTGQVLLLSLVLGMLAVAFGVFVYHDVKTKLAGK